MKSIGNLIEKVINGKNLYYQEAYRAFELIFKDEVSDFEAGAFLAALSTKGENSDEIMACYEVIYKYDTVKVDVEMDITENSGTGRDSIKTFNVSTAASITAAAGGVNIAKHGARAITSRCGSIDILEAIGINVNLNVKDSANILKKIGITVFNGMSPEVHRGVLYNILKKIHFGSIFNISASLASPVKPSFGVRGVFNRDIITKTATVMKKIGYKKGMVFWGTDYHDRGMDEISPIGETYIIEFDESSFSELYRIDPSYFRVKEINPKNIMALETIEEEKNRFLSVIRGQKYEDCIIFTAMNAAPIFYINRKTKDLREGYELALDLLYSGRVWDKYSEWQEESANN